MAATVTFDGTRVNDADSATNWGHWGGSGPAPASEPQLRYQYSGSGSVGALNKKASGTGSTYNGIDYDPGSGGLNMETAPFPLWFLKTYVSDFSDLNATYGVRASAGSALSARYEWNMAGTGANRAPLDEGYPSQGGYLIASINPNIAAWREDTVGSPDLTDVDWFGVQVLFITGGAKDVNFAIDALDVGRGLFAVGTAFDLSALIATDQDTLANRWGVVSGAPSAFDCIGLTTIGRDSGGTAQATMDDYSIVTFPDGYQGPGDVGFLVDLDTGSSAVNFYGLYISNGLIATSDTRADLVFDGTTGASGVYGQFRNFRNVTLTSVCTVDGADIECALLTQASADIENTVIRTNALTQVATLQDPTFGASTDLNNTEFIQVGVGHAIELDTATTYTFTNLTFDVSGSGYGGTAGSNETPSSGADDAVVYNSSGGEVTINISGGDVPSVRNAAGSTTIVVASNDYTVNNLQDPSDVTILDRDVSMLDITGTAADQNVGDATANTKVGQSFQIAVTGKVERIRLNLRKVGTPTDSIRIRLADGNPGSTELLVSTYLSGANLTTSYVEYDIDLDGKTSLSTSTDYGIEIERSGANDGSNYYQIEYSTTSVDSTGERWLNDGSWASSTGDLLLSVLEAASDNQLHFADAVSTGSTTYPHGGVAKTIEVIVSSLNYLQVVYLADIGGSDASQAVVQIPDLVYYNP